ncbi:hypothetical protein MJT46_002861 [Ovis ammon polii x Ovis aries]|nr:hypothetical protein MJT46_002861 [Ovis ammon polii x Ovis aries]
MEPAASKLFPGRRGNDQLEADTNFPCPLTPTPVSWHALEVVHGRAELLLREILCKTSMHFRAGFSMDELAWASVYVELDFRQKTGFAPVLINLLQYCASHSSPISPHLLAVVLWAMALLVHPVFVSSSSQTAKCSLQNGKLEPEAIVDLCLRVPALEIRFVKYAALNLQGPIYGAHQALWPYGYFTRLPLKVMCSDIHRTLMHTHLSLGKQMNPILLEHLSKRRVNKCGAAFIFLYIKVP